MTLLDLRDLLLTVTSDVFHYHAHKKPDKYIVWAEDGQGDSVFADEKMEDRALQGTIDYFTKTEFDPNVELFQTKLTEAEISWRLNSVQHEDDTGYIHYEWIWELI
jgi:hypothetical protein